MKASKRSKIIKACFLILFICTGFLCYILFFLPLPVHLTSFADTAPIRIYDRNGILLYEQKGQSYQDRTHLSLLPDYLIDATLAIEDQRFYEHGGIDTLAILRAIWSNVQSNAIVSGASTIDQQLIRNILGTERPRSVENKIWESLYALRISTMYSKDTILEQYFRTIYYGNQAYGITTASKKYFGKEPYDLDLAESSFLAGIPQNPALYNPFTNFENTKKRQKEVLNALVAQKKIELAEAEKAFAQDIRFISSEKNIQAPHFVFFVLNQLKDTLSQNTDIHTTLDAYLQESIQEKINYHLTQLQGKNVTNAAAMVLSNDGQIIAMIGSKDFFDSQIDGQVNVVVNPRQPGSTLKPFLYLAAFEKGWTPATSILDIPTKFSTAEGTPYTPQNYDQNFRGMVLLREALANSYNIPAVKALDFVGVSNFIHFLERFGITSLENDADFYGLALALGDGEISLYNLVKAYSILGNQGIQKPIRYILAGPSSGTSTEEKIINPEIAYLITDILKDEGARTESFGENSVLSVPGYSVKTGTSRNFKDNWTIGYSADFTIGVWVGNNDASSMKNISGVEGAGPIFQDVASLLNSTYGIKEIKKPENIIEKTICWPSGKLASADCPEKRQEIFIPGTEPKEQDTAWKIQNGKPVLSLSPEIAFWMKRLGYPTLTGQAEKTFLEIIAPGHLDEYRIDSEIPLSYQKLFLRAVRSSDIKEIEWFVNGTSIGKGDEIAWILQEGNFKITAKGSSSLEKTVSITVYK